MLAVNGLAESGGAPLVGWGRTLKQSLVERVGVRTASICSPFITNTSFVIVPTN